VALHTASAIITFYSRLEDQATQFYRDAAANDRYAAGQDTFLALAQENQNQKAMIRRVYQEVITDAFEACFSFPNLHEGTYRVDSEVPEALSYLEGLAKAITIEDTSYHFCTEASEKSKALLAGIPQAFHRVATRKAKRKLLLQSFLDAERSRGETQD